MLADRELGRADEVADVLDHKQVDLVQRDPADRQRTMQVEVALAAEGGVGAGSGDRHVQVREPVGIEATPDVALEDTDPDVAGVLERAFQERRLPAPGALIKLITVTPRASKSARFSRAIVWLASSAPSRDLNSGPMHCRGSHVRPARQSGSPPAEQPRTAPYPWSPLRQIRGTTDDRPIPLAMLELTMLATPRSSRRAKELGP